MLLPASLFAPGGCVTRAWGDGAYSDDLILASLAGSLRRRILCPGCAVFPIHLEPRCTAAQAWNYLRRQTYVLDTYTFDHNRCVGRTAPTSLPCLTWGLCVAQTSEPCAACMYSICVLGIARTYHCHRCTRHGASRCTCAQMCGAFTACGGGPATCRHCWRESSPCSAQATQLPWCRIVRSVSVRRSVLLHCTGCLNLTSYAFSCCSCRPLHVQSAVPDC